MKHTERGIQRYFRSISYVRSLRLLANNISPRLHEVMGDILGEWLKSTILRELSDGLQWLGSNSVDSAIVNSHFEDDGRILKAKISKPGNVQIEKVLRSCFSSLLSLPENSN